MINICYVDEDGRYGGPQARMLEINKNINKKKFNIYFLIPKKIKIFKKRLKNINANFEEINLTRLSADIRTLLKYIFFFLYEIYNLVKIFKSKKFDLIQSNGVPQFKTIIAAKISRIPSIWIVEDAYSPKIIVILFRFLAKISNCKIIYISKKSYNFYLKDTNINNKNLFEVMSPTDSKFFKRKKK